MGEDTIIQISVAMAGSLVVALVVGTTWLLRQKHTQENHSTQIEELKANTKELQRDASRKLTALSESVASLERWRERTIGAAQAKSGRRVSESTIAPSRRNSDRDSDGDIPIV